MESGLLSRHTVKKKRPMSYVTMSEDKHLHVSLIYSLGKRDRGFWTLAFIYCFDNTIQQKLWQTREVILYMLSSGHQHNSSADKGSNPTDLMSQIQTLDQAVSVLLYTNAFWNGMNLSLLPSPLGKLSQTESVSFVNMQTSLEEGTTRWYGANNSHKILLATKTKMV